MNDIFLRLHPDYDELSVKAKRKLRFEKEFIEDYYDKIIEVCNEYEKQKGKAVSDGLLAYIVRCSWATVLHLKLSFYDYVDFNKKTDKSSLKQKTLVNHLPEIISLWEKYKKDFDLDEVDALRTAVNEKCVNDIMFNLYPNYEKMSYKDKNKIKHEKVFIIQHLDEIVNVYENLRKSSKRNENVLLREALDDVWANDLFTTLHPNYEQLTGEDKDKADEDRHKIKNNLNEIISMMKDLGIYNYN